MGELEGAPFHLGVSMFERLVNNNVEFSTLTCQRRMIPEIRKILSPLYDNLVDHPSVLDRAPVPGMGDVRSYFFTHSWPESTDDYSSRCNYMEASMIVGFFTYLVLNGVKPADITILTFYNGQRKVIMKLLKSQAYLEGLFFNVKTVDAYQGEENVVVLLSLVRSNDGQNVGFLSVENRVCVALSRAQRGLYIFGNARNLCKASSLWWKVVRLMAEQPRRLGAKFPITCEPHQHKLWIQGTSRSRRILSIQDTTDHWQIQRVGTACMVDAIASVPESCRVDIRAHPNVTRESHVPFDLIYH